MANADTVQFLISYRVAYRVPPPKKKVSHYQVLSLNRIKNRH